jgi:hypothetical protein
MTEMTIIQLHTKLNMGHRPGLGDRSGLRIMEDDSEEYKNGSSISWNGALAILQHLL